MKPSARMNVANAIFAARVRDARIKIGMSQETLAAESGYKHRISIHRIEAGKDELKISLYRLFSMAKALKISASALLKGIKL